MAPLLELEHVRFAYNREPILRDVSFRVERGRFVGLVGPNGSGKTTLLRLILGLLSAQSGRVRLFGEDIRQFTDWWRLGYVPQKAVSLAHGFPATVMEVVLTGLRRDRKFGQRVTAAGRERAKAALAHVGMAGHANTRISWLSGGQQQRVFIARALAGEPELLILDEPTVGVDAAGQDQFYALLHDLRQRLGLTVLLVSHDIGAVTAAVTDLLCLNRTVFYHGPPEGFTDSHLCEFYGHHVSLISHRH